MSASKVHNKMAIVIPAYNEEAAIESVIDDIRHTFHGDNYDIILVDDSSRDATATIAEEKGCIVLRHLINSGSGAGTTTGLAFALGKNYDIAATVDADGQHSAKDLKKCINYLLESGSDLVIGSRLLDSTGMSLLKQIGNKGLSLITYALFGINVTDSQSGLRVFSRTALEKIKLRSTGYEFCSEMLWRAKQQNLKIGEYPIRAIYTDYSKSKGQNNWNGFVIVRSLISRRIMELFYE